MKKIQKKFYLKDSACKLIRTASYKSGISQSKIVEAVLTVHLVRRALAKG